MSLVFARFDLQSWLPRTQTLLPLAFIVVIGIVLPVPGMAIAASAIVTMLLVPTPFLGDERGRLDTLYGTLPVSRTSIVVGRTLAIVALNAVAVIVANASTLLVALARGGSPDPQVLLLVNAGAFALVGLAVALQLPVFFRIGYSRGRLMAYAPALVIAGLAWIGQETGLITSNVAPPAPIPVLAAIGFAIGLIGIIAGAVVAARLYRDRELR